MHVGRRQPSIVAARHQQVEAIELAEFLHKPQVAPCGLKPLHEIAAAGEKPPLGAQAQ